MFLNTFRLPEEPTGKPDVPVRVLPTDSAAERGTSPEGSTTAVTASNSTEEESNMTVCKTADCVHIASLFRSSIARTINPCQDFYHYVCQGNKHVLLEFRQNTSRAIRDSFLQIAGLATRTSAFEKAVDFYNVCLVVDGQRDDNIHVLQSFFSGNRIFFTEDSEIDPMDTMLSLLVRYGIPVLIEVSVDPNGLYEGNYRLWVKESKEFQFLMLGRERGTPNVPDAQISQVLHNLGVTNPEYTRSVAARIREAEEQLFGIRQGSSGETTKFAPLEALFNSSPLAERWKASLSEHSNNVLPGNYQARYQVFLCSFLVKAFTDVEAAAFNTYIAWHVARQFSKLAKLNPAGGGSSNRGVPDCYEETRTMFKHLVTAPYLRSIVNHSRLSAVSSMVTNIREMIATGMQASGWLEEPTKTALVKKLRAMRFQIGFPKGLDTLQDIEAYYRSYPPMAGPFLKSFLDASNARAKALLKSLADNPADLENLDVDDSQAADTDPPSNIIRIPATMTLSPLFNYGAPEAINNGALGSTIVHEIMRRFEGDWRFKNEYGEALPWTTDSNNVYGERKRCYNRKLKQNAAGDKYHEDVTALKSHYEAYKVAVSTLSSSPGISDLELFSDDQMFFISRCLVFCQHSSSLSESSEPQGRRRCNIPLSNSLYFATAFRCRRGSPMNPKEKCTFW